jgi:hypothetical protein
MMGEFEAKKRTVSSKSDGMVTMRIAAFFPRTSKLRKRRFCNNTFQNQDMLTVYFSSKIRFKSVLNFSNGFLRIPFEI